MIRKMRSTKGWEEEEGWLLLFFCINFPMMPSFNFWRMGQRRKMKSLWKEMRDFDCEWSVNKNFITLKNEVNNMASPFL